MVNSFFEKSPLKEYKSYFNVWRVDAVSAESGVCESGKCSKNTAFNGYFYCMNIARAPCVDNSKVYTAVSSVLENNQRVMITVVLNT